MKFPIYLKENLREEDNFSTRDNWPVPNVSFVRRFYCIAIQTTKQFLYINPLNPIVHFWLHHTAHCEEKIVSARYAGWFCVNRKGGTGGGGWGHPQGDMHMVAARLGCQSAMVGTGWANCCPGCMDRLRKHYSHLVRGSFLAGKVAWTLSGCMTTESADYCMLVNEWVWSRSRV